MRTLGGGGSLCIIEGPLLEPRPQTSSLQACERSAVPAPGLRAWTCSPRTLPPPDCQGELGCTLCMCVVLVTKRIHTHQNRTETRSLGWGGGLSQLAWGSSVLPQGVRALL